MKVEITHNDIHEIAKQTSKVLARYIKSARDYPIPAESIEGIIEQGIQGWVEGRTERDNSPTTEPYEEPQPTDTVYGC